MVSSEDPEKMCAPSLDQHNEFTLSPCPLISRSSLPSFDHARIVLSVPALVNSSPCGEYLMVFTESSPVFMGSAICLPVSGFQRRIVPSRNPLLATSRALGDQS